MKYQPLEIKGTHAFLRAMLNAGEDDLEAELRQYVLFFIASVALFFLTFNRIPFLASPLRPNPTFHTSPMSHD